MDTINTFRGKYRFLSNFYYAEITYEDMLYPTVEHAFQAMKTLSVDERIKIGQADTPGNAKRLGRGVTLRPDWNTIRYGVMLDLVLQKFRNHKSLREQLIATNDALLVEGNTWGDTTWGVCNGTGTNWLGNILMEVRSLCNKPNPIGREDMLTVYTAQYKYKGPNRTDVTVKGSVPPWNIFAPTWDMVNEYLANPSVYQERVYTARYEALVANAYVANKDAITTLIHSNGTRVLVCFCKAGVFCHRVLLAVHLASLGADYRGELYKGNGGIWITK